MPRIKVMAPSGERIAEFKDAELTSAPDLPNDENYAEIEVPGIGTYEYFGSVIIERFTKEDANDDEQPAG